MARYGVAVILGFMLVMVISGPATALAQPLLPSMEINFIESDGPEEVAAGLRLILLLTVLSLAPALLIMLTSFTRIVVVLAFTRNALATQHMPPNQVMVGLALFLTLFVMAPVIQVVTNTAWIPFQEGEIDLELALSRAEAPVREFMFRHTRERDLALFMEVSGLARPSTEDDIPIHVLIPAFAISELRTAFQMGFVIFIPFIVIDMVVASTLMSMGMLMLPPMMISLPFKILLFVLVDGWHIVVRSLVAGFGV